jgi:hypothetical protein
MTKGSRTCSHPIRQERATDEGVRPARLTGANSHAKTNVIALQRVKRASGRAPDGHRARGGAQGPGSCDRGPLTPHLSGVGSSRDGGDADGERRVPNRRCALVVNTGARTRNVAKGRRNYGDHDKGLAPLSLCESR